MRDRTRRTVRVGLGAVAVGTVLVGVVGAAGGDLHLAAAGVAAAVMALFARARLGSDAVARGLGNDDLSATNETKRA